MSVLFEGHALPRRKPSRLPRRLTAGGLPIASLLLLLAWPMALAQAGNLVWASGRVLDSGGRPMPNAVVVVYDDNNHVVDHTRTDQNGEYAVGVPEHVLHLRRTHGKGFITSVFNGMTRFVGGVAGYVANPLRQGVHAVTNGAEAVAPDLLTKGEIAAGGEVADQAFFGMTPRQKTAIPVQERKLPGSLFIKVAAPDRNDLVAVTHVYWMQEEEAESQHKKRTLAAWLDPVELTPMDSDDPSRVRSTYLRFTSAHLEPSVAEPGDTVDIVTKLSEPPDPQVYVVVVARDHRTGKTWELTPMGDGRYVGEIQVDKHFSRDDHILSILAYPQHEEWAGRNDQTERTLEKDGFWDPKKPYIYDPLLVASRNRPDLILTVVAPSRRRNR